MNERFLRCVPDSLFAIMVNLRGQKSEGERVRIGRKNGSWWITVGDMGLFSPTSKFTSFGMKHFEQKFERVVKIEPGDTCLDVGACIGDTTVPMCRKGKTVIAVEPCYTNFEYLKFNTEQWRCGNPGIHLVRYAVSNWIEKYVTMYKSDAITGHSTEPDEDREAGCSLVPSITLDGLNDAYGPFDFAKIDIQGAEAEIFRPNAEKFLRSTQKLVVECHRTKNGGTLSKVYTSISPYFDKVITVTDDRMVHASK